MGDLSSARRARIAAGALILLALFLPTSSAQTPAIPGQEAALHLAIICEDSFLEPDYTQMDVASCIIQDFARDSIGAPGSATTGPSIHTVALTTRPAPGFENVTGWQILVSDPNFAMRGGESRRIDVRAVATPSINRDEYHFELVAEYRAQTGYNETVSVPFVAQVNPYGFATTNWVTSPVKQAGQDEVVIYELAIENAGVYPDMYQLTITMDSAFRVSTLPNLYVDAGETRSVNISILTPKGKVYEIGRSAPIVVKITSLGVGDVPGTGVYSAAATLKVQGAHVPVYWFPLTLVGLVSATIVAKAGSQKQSQRARERGTPRAVAVTPRQAVLLAELKRSDRDSYRAKKTALDVVYKERVADYRGHKKERIDADRKEAREAKIEFAAQKKARKAQEIEDKRARVVARRAEKVEAADLKKREKVLAKARKKLAKAQRKQGKLDAKAAKKQAKLDAKSAKVAAKQALADAKIAKANERAQAKADKAAAKTAKPSEKRPPS